MLTIGWATRILTPPRPALIQGQMHIRIGRTAADPLTCTAMALDSGTADGRTILVSCDLAMVSDGLVKDVRTRLAAALPDVPPEAVLLNGTHTHDGPVEDDSFYPHPGGDLMTGPEVRRWLADQIVAAAVEAWAGRTPRKLGRAFGHAVVGHNRRAVYDTGLAVMYGKTARPDFRYIEGYEDHSVDLLFIWEPDGVLSGVAVAVPCPSQVDEHLHAFSADYWHEVRVELRQRFGQRLQVLPLCSAAGDQSPHFLLYTKEEQEMRRRRGLTERQEIARRIADAVSSALTVSQPFAQEPVVAHRLRRIAFPRRRVTKSERDWAAQRREDALRQGMRADLWWPRLLDLVVRCHDKGEPMPVQEGELHMVRIGDLALATNPFELYIDFGLQIKARSKAAQTLVVQLSCGTGLYLPTERAVAGGHYGAHPVVAPVGPEGGQVLVEETLKAIEELFA